MLALFETAAGYALFKVKDESKVLENSLDLFEQFETPEKALKFVKLQGFSKFENTVEALAGVTALVEGKLHSGLKSFLEEQLKGSKDKLAVVDPKLGGAIAKKLGFTVVSDSSVQELYRGIRNQMDSLLTGLSSSDLSSMQLGLSHSLSRYKLKFSPDKVDTMIVQAICLLDDLDKDLNTYAMRCKEWYGWHFPEMARIIVDNLAFAKIIKLVGFRTNIINTDLSDILPETLEDELKQAAEISMGTEISQEDIMNIEYLCDQIISLTTYRTELYEYLQNRMRAIAPNLTALLGELVGARLISHAGSLMSLAKVPASTIQIMGAEKALFRALKSKHDTPKYGLLYHSSLVGQATPKFKGKAARFLATKASLSIRLDALGESSTNDMGIAQRLELEDRVRILEGKPRSMGAPLHKNNKKFESNSNNAYNTATDSTIAPKRKIEEVNGSDNLVVSKKDVSSDDEDSTEVKEAKKEKKEKKAKKEKKETKDDEKAEKKEKKAKKEKKEKKEKKSKD